MIKEGPRLGHHSTEGQLLGAVPADLYVVVRKRPGEIHPGRLNKGPVAPDLLAVPGPDPIALVAEARKRKEHLVNIPCVLPEEGKVHSPLVLAEDELREDVHHTLAVGVGGEGRVHGHPDGPVEHIGGPAEALLLPPVPLDPELRDGDPRR